MRMLLFMALLLGLTFPAAAQEETLVGRDPEKAVDFIINLYERAGPRLGCRFVESCYLLTLSDWRARGAWNGVFKGTAEDVARIEELNTWLMPHGLQLKLEDRSLDIYSLAGLEYTSERSHVEWMQPFSRESGWPGLETWRKEAYQRMGTEKHTSPFHYMEGFLLGYPDRAVEGYCSPEGDHTQFTLEATISDVARYECGLPTFSLLAKDYDDPGVRDTEQAWGKFLRSVYDHPRMRALLTSPEFLSARRDKTGKAIEIQYPPDPNTSEERLLAQGKLAEKMEAVPDLAAFTYVSKRTLRRWVLRAGLNPEDPAAELAAIVRRRWPAQVVEWVKQELLLAEKRIPREDLQAGKFIHWKHTYVNFYDMTREPEFPAVQATLTPEQLRQLEADIALVTPAVSPR